MRFYSFGHQNNPVLLLLPGTCCHWKSNFGSVIPLLEKDFYVVCTSYNGFDETEQTVFPDMLTAVAKIEDYIQANFGGHIRAAYGCSMGDSFVGLLIQRGNIHIDHGILGSSDLVTPLEDGISVPGTAVHIFYAVKMGKQYEARYRQHFKDPDIRTHDMQHEELLVCYPQQWADEVRLCCGMNKK